MKKFLFCAFALLLISGCKPGDGKGGLVNVEPPKMSNMLKDVGLDFQKNITSSTVTGLSIPEVNGVVISTVNITVLEHFNQPLVRTDEIIIFKTEKYPKNTRIKKIRNYYDNGKLTGQDITIIEPAK
jgi:hypothetical protein